MACTPTALATLKKPLTQALNGQLYYGYSTRAKHAYGDRQYYKRNPPTGNDHSKNEALLPPRTSAWAKCTYSDLLHDGSTSLPRTQLQGRIIAQRKCTYGWGLLYQCFSTAITVMAILDEMQLHRIAMKSGVTLEPSAACQVNIYVERQVPTCPSRIYMNPWRRIHYSRATHLSRGISLQSKHCYRRERLHEQSALLEKTPHDKNLSVNSSEHIAAIHCAAWSAFTSTIVMDNRSPPTVSHTVHERYVRDVHGERQCIRPLIHCGATSISMAPRLLWRIGQPSELAYIATFGLDNRVWCWRKTVGKRQSRNCLYVFMILYSL